MERYQAKEKAKECFKLDYPGNRYNVCRMKHKKKGNTFGEF